MRKVSLQTRLLILFTTGTAAILLSLGGAAIYLMVHHLKDVQLANLRELSRFAATEVSHEIRDKEHLLLQLADNREIIDYPDTYRLPPLATHLADHKSDFPVISFINADGIEELLLRDGQPVDSVDNYAGIPEFMAAKAQPGRVSVTLGRNPGTLVFTLGVKRYFGDVFVGCLRAEVPITSVARHLGDVRVGKAGFIGVETGDEQLLGLPGRGSAASWQGGAVDGMHLAGIDRLLDPLLLEFNGHKAYAISAATEIPVLKVMAVLPYEEFVAGPHLLAKLVAGAGVLFLVLGAVIAYFLGGRVSRPLSQLIHTLHGFSAGQRREIEVTRAPAEVVDLVEAFNSMVRTLDQTMVSRDYLDNIFESMHESLIVAGLDGRIERVNRATCDLLGYLPSEIEGQSIAQVVVGEDCDESHWLDHVTRTAGHFRERTYRHRDGEHIQVAFSWVRLQDAAGKTCGLVCFAQRQDPANMPSKWRMRMRSATE